MANKLVVGDTGTLPVRFEFKSVVDEKTKQVIEYLELSCYCEVLDVNVKLTTKEKADKKLLNTICSQYLK